MKYRLAACLLLLIGTACGGGKKSFEKNFQTVMGPESSSLRGVNLGDSYADVLSTEASEYLEFQDSTMIRYTLHYTDSEEYKIVYLFEEDFVQEIQMDIFLGQKSDGEAMSKLFKKRFDKKYGFSEDQKGIQVWNKDGESVELWNESEVFGYGKIRIHIFPTLPDPNPGSSPVL